jgi:hypothetical protein
VLGGVVTGAASGTAGCAESVGAAVVVLGDSGADVVGCAGAAGLVVADEGAAGETGALVDTGVAGVGVGDGVAGTGAAGCAGAGLT